MPTRGKSGMAADRLGYVVRRDLRVCNSLEVHAEHATLSLVEERETRRPLLQVVMGYGVETR